MENNHFISDLLYIDLFRGRKVTDYLTDQVFFSDLLPTKCPVLYKALSEKLHEKGVHFGLLNNTKDIWCRDYMPIQIGAKRFIFYKYNPDYLQTPYYRRTITDVNQIAHIECLENTETIHLDLVIDGGNIIKCGETIVMTEKVFAENKDKTRNEITQQLENAFQCDIVFLPWDKDEIFGHSDGIIHYIGNNQILMTNYADYNPQMASKFFKILERYFEVIPLSYNVKRKHQRNWAYINFLQVGTMVFVPQLDIEEDELALQHISEAMPGFEVVGIPALEAVRKGGALNCISWNVNTRDWCKGFMSEEYRIGGYTISKLFERAEKGKSSSQNDLGNCYSYGIGLEQDKLKGLDWYKKAAEKGLSDAIYNVGNCYFHGEGVEKDLSEALKWFQLAAEKKHNVAQYYVARCYEELHYPDYEVYAAYRKAAEMGESKSQQILGEMYQEGSCSVTKDEVEAVSWYRKSAEQWNPYAECCLGECYDFGIGVKKSPKEALKWYKRAASFGSDSAQLRIGLCYLFGNAVRKDEQMAVRWFRKAAAQNHPGALFRMGECYEDGIGVEKNSEIAVEWYMRAAEQGSERAKAKLKKEENCPF